MRWWWRWFDPAFFFSFISCPSARSKGRQGRRVVEVHCQHHFCLQTRWAPHSPRGPATVGACQGCGLQMPKDQAWKEVPAPGYRRWFPWAERRCGRQGKLAHPLEGPVGAPAEEVPTAWQEGKVLKAAGEERERERWKERWRQNNISIRMNARKWRG